MRLAPAPLRDGELSEPAPDQDEHEVGAEARPSHRADDQVDDPACALVAAPAGPPQAGAEQAQTCAHGDRRDGRPRTGSRAADPVRRRVGEEQGREDNDRHHRRDDEAEPSDDGAGRAGDPTGAIDCELGRGRAGEQVATGESVLEVALGDPSSALDDEPPEQRDMGGWAAEAGHPDARPLASDFAQRDADVAIPRRPGARGTRPAIPRRPGARGSRPAHAPRPAAISRSDAPVSRNCCHSSSSIAPIEE